MIVCETTIVIKSTTAKTVIFCQDLILVAVLKPLNNSAMLKTKIESDMNATILIINKSAVSNLIFSGALIFFATFSPIFLKVEILLKKKSNNTGICEMRTELTISIILEFLLKILDKITKTKMATKKLVVVYLKAESNVNWSSVPIL